MRFTFNEIKASLKVMENIPMDKPVDVVLFFSNVMASVGVAGHIKSSCYSEVEKDIINERGIKLQSKRVTDVGYSLKDGTTGVVTIHSPIALCTDEDILSEIASEITPCYQYYSAILDKLTEKTGISEVEIATY